MMSRSITLKMLLIGVLALLLLIPLSMVSGLVKERKAYREQAIQSVADGAAGSQKLQGPVWVLPYRQKFIEQVSGEPGTTREVWRSYTIQQLPEKLSVSGGLRTYPRQRGIYITQLYTADLEVKGQFTLPDVAALGGPDNIELGQPYLSVGIADVRGIKASPTVQWAGHGVGFQPGAKLKALGGGIHAPLALNRSEGTVAFSFALSLEGMDALEFIPLGRDTEVALQSDWRHPSFGGRFLPESREVGAQGFTARWRTSWFATNLNEHFEQCMAGQCIAFQQAALGVRLIEPVDMYVQTDRAIKYGFLFVFLTFCVFFLTEVLKRVAIHPVQYSLVGLSLAVFFLLLLSLAEQLSFPLAYGVAALACVLQNGMYARHALGSRSRGVLFMALLAGLYGVLFLLLCSEDLALLLGSLLLFAVLSGVMLLTRSLNWYGLDKTPVRSTVEPQAGPGRWGEVRAD